MRKLILLPLLLISLAAFCQPGYDDIIRIARQETDKIVTERGYQSSSEVTALSAAVVGDSIWSLRRQAGEFWITDPLFTDNDDEVAFMNAVNAARPVRGVVVLPEGEFNIAMEEGVDGVIDLHDSATVRGAGIDKTILQSTPETATHYYDIITCLAGSNIRISDMTIKGPVTSNSTNNIRGIYHAGTSGSLIVENVKFVNCSMGVYGDNGTERIEVYKCEFTCPGQLSDGIFAMPTGRGSIKVRDSYFHDIGSSDQHHGLYIRYTFDVDIQGCTFYNIPGYAYQEYSGDPYYSGGIKAFINNTIDSCGYGIITGPDTTTVFRIIGNDFDRITTNAITLLTGSRSIISNNVFKKFGSYGIRSVGASAGCEATISDNYFYLWGSSTGLYSDHFNIWNVTGNSAYNYGTALPFITSNAGDIFTSHNRLFYGATMTGNTAE